MSFFSRTSKDGVEPQKVKIDIPSELRRVLERGELITDDMKTKFMPLVDEKLPDKAELVRIYLGKYNDMTRMQRLGLGRLVLKFVGG